MHGFQIIIYIGKDLDSPDGLLLTVGNLLCKAAVKKQHVTANVVLEVNAHNFQNQWMP